MTTEIAKKQKCLRLRSGIEIWLDEEKWIRLEEVLSSLAVKKFIDIEGRIINTADIEGIYKPEDLEELNRRKNGQWKCDYNIWHHRNETCECAQKAWRKKQQEDLDKQMGK